ncbi:carbonic anhydrase [Camelimonas sp. ID_303_24]
MAREAVTNAFPTRLTEGYKAFLNERFPSERNRFQILAERGQSPETLIIGCCDSRVSPEVIFDASPGELFVVRNVANLVPPYETGGDFHGTSAALEFAVQALKVKHIVVLGHQMCGGIKAFANHADPLSPGDFIGKWMAQIQPAADALGAQARTGADYITRLEFAAIELSLRNLLTFPCVRILAERNQIALHGAYFGVADGVLRVRNPQTGEFEPAVEGLEALGRMAPRCD